MKKRLEEMVVPENADIVETIIQLAEESKAWIYLSNDLVARLEKLYPPKQQVALTSGIVVFVVFEKYKNHYNKLIVDLDVVWNKVSVIPKKLVYIAQDPEVIYFLS